MIWELIEQMMRTWDAVYHHAKLVQITFCSFTRQLKLEEEQGSWENKDM